MRGEYVELSYKETERLRLLEQVDAGGMTLKQAAELMGVSYRQAKRLRATLKRAGPWALAHGLRRQRSNRRFDEAFRDSVLARYRERYMGFGPTLACEKLVEDGFTLSRETLRRWLKSEHLWLGRQRERAHRRQRKRRKGFGELVQMDGSDHDWFEGRAARCCLMVMIDDATGKVHARFGPSENLPLARETLAGWLERFGGIPQFLYIDRLSLYHARREPTEEERRQGSGALTVFGQVCFRLGIRLIAAGSPQAKGRVERMNGTLQDRLVKELRLAGIASIEEANRFLESGFLDDLNQRFSHPPLSPVNYHRSLPPGTSLNEAVSLQSRRQVQNDWTVTYGARTLQILTDSHVPQPKSRVTIHERLDGSLAVTQGEKEVAFQELDDTGRILTDQSPSPMGEGGGGGLPPRRESKPPPDRAKRAGDPRTFGPAPAPQGDISILR
jgi:transposase